MKQVKVRKELRISLLEAKLNYLEQKVKNYLFYNTLYKGEYQKEVDNLWLKIRLCRLLLGKPEFSYSY